MMDRMLVAPAWRGAFNLGSVVQSMIQVVVQTLLIVLLALALGADYTNGVGGVLVLLLVAALMAAIFASFSNGIAILTGQRETLIGAVSALLLPLTFLSGALMQLEPRAGLDRDRGQVQPGRLGSHGGAQRHHRDLDWGVVAGRVGLLAALTLLAAWFATRAFSVYQRSL